MKERIFRDYGQFLVSKTVNLTVVQEWKGGLALNVTLVLVDPLGRLAYVHDVNIPQGNDNYVVTKIYLDKLLLPGEWAAKLVYREALVAKTSFLVLPDIYHKRVYDGSSLLAYDMSPYNVPYPTEKMVLLQKVVDELEVVHPTIEELKQTLHGSHSSILAWIDDLVIRFWKPNAVCSLVKQSTCDILPICNTTTWSSFSPDPKSEIGLVDPKTGKFVLPFNRRS